MQTIEDAAVAGAWKSLCAGVMLHAVERLSAETKLHRPGSTYKTRGDSGLYKEKLHQKTYAKQWIEGGIGSITFEDCCESLGVDPGRVRSRIVEYCHERRRRPAEQFDARY
jgi:hypothetical protein